MRSISYIIYLGLEEEEAMRQKAGKLRSITQRMVLVLVLIVLPFNIVSVVSTMLSVKNARDQAVASMENMASMALLQLESRISATNDLFYNLDEVSQDFELYKKQGERQMDLLLAEVNLASYFNTIVENDGFGDVLYWVSEPYNRTYIGMDGLSNEKFKNAARCKMALKEFLNTEEKKKYSRWGILELDGVTWLMKSYLANGLYYGSMFSLDEIEYNIRKSSTFDGMELSFSEEKPEAGSEKGKLVVTQKCEKGNFWMKIAVPSREGYTNLSALQILCIGFAFLYVLLIPLLILIIRRMVLKPLQNVSDAMVHLRNGEQDYRITVQEREAEEFAEIGGTFNDMADRIRELRIANYEKELERKRVELRNLQLQIRPHFLMNMFNLLYSFAQIENYHSIQKLALYLSDYFRYIFQSGRDLQPFGRELDLIQKYLEIAAMRYPDCCEAVYEIDPEVLEVEVPPLLIHNFVENIFKHIVNHDRKINLRIEAYTDDVEATFIIADDGPGMEKQMADDINHGIFNKKEGDRVHVGIENSWRRIRYFYGEAGRLTVDSELGQGTCFTIVIPLKEYGGE